MTVLAIYSEDQPGAGVFFHDVDAITQQLSQINVQFERWQAQHPIEPGATQEQILTAYDESVQRLKQQYGFQSADVISLHGDHPNAAQLRQKFLAEHTHSDFEVRFFVAGKGLFSLHIGDQVYALLCEQGDLICVPAGARHWFDMGEKPEFTCIRLFTDEAGWVADFTGDPIASGFPTLDQFVSLA
ncbi:MAG: cupin [Methylococcaceae bacterium]|nr:cupin [Methylococcaceae bacterium]